jgi:hypothetical protein
MNLQGGSIARGKYHLGLITNAASDSCAVNYALTIRLGMRQESRLVLIPFACQRMYHTETIIPLGCINMGGTPQFLMVPVSMMDCDELA